MKKHGMGETRFYRIWCGMKSRCADKKSLRYGGRGIKVCDKWMIFEYFFLDMYKGYISHCDKFGEKNTTIDRIDNNGDYSKKNCRWTHYKNQARNKNNNILITYNGEKKSLPEWADKFGINQKTFRVRLDRGFTHKQAIEHKRRSKVRSGNIEPIYKWKSKLSMEDRNNLKEDRKRGMKTSELAEKYGISTHHAWRIYTNRPNN